VLQCVAVCCSVLQCVAVCCSVLQCVVQWRQKETKAAICTTTTKHLIRVPWLINVCDMTHEWVWHDSFMCVSFKCVTWLVHVRDITHLYATCLRHVSFDMTHSNMRHDSFTRVRWLIHTCDMTHSYTCALTYSYIGWHVSLICMMWVFWCVAVCCSVLQCVGLTYRLTCMMWVFILIDSHASYVIHVNVSYWHVSLICMMWVFILTDWHVWCECFTRTCATMWGIALKCECS